MSNYCSSRLEVVIFKVWDVALDFHVQVEQLDHPGYLVLNFGYLFLVFFAFEILICYFKQLADLMNDALLGSTWILLIASWGIIAGGVGSIDLRGVNIVIINYIIVLALVFIPQQWTVVRELLWVRLRLVAETHLGLHEMVSELQEFS